MGINEINKLGGQIPDLFDELTKLEGTQEAKEVQEIMQIAEIGQPSADSLESAGVRSYAEGPVASTSQALTENKVTLPNVEDPNCPPGMPFYAQGSANACGTTSLAMIMSYLGVPETKEDIDNQIRRLNTFTSPEDIVRFARSQGLEAEDYNNGTWQELKSQIDAGHPVQCLIQANSSLGYNINGPHYIDITGYQTDPATGKEYVLYHDPNEDGLTAGGTEGKMPVEDFEKMWGSTTMPPGAHNFYIAFGKSGDTLPPSRTDGMEGMLGAAEGITNVTNGLNRIYSPDNFGCFVHGISQFPGGLAQTIGCGIGGGVQWLGQNLNKAVDGIPVLQNIVKPFGDALNGAGAVVSDLCNSAGEVCDDVGGAFDMLFNGDAGGFVSGLGSAVGDAAGGVVDAVGDAASAVGNAISDVFSGW